MSLFAQPEFQDAYAEPPNVFSPEGAIDLHVSPEMRLALRAMIDKNRNGWWWIFPESLMSTVPAWRF